MTRGVIKQLNQSFTYECAMLTLLTDETCFYRYGRISFSFIRRNRIYWTYYNYYGDLCVRFLINTNMPYKVSDHRKRLLYRVIRDVETAKLISLQSIVLSLPDELEFEIKSYMQNPTEIRTTERSLQF